MIYDIITSLHKPETKFRAVERAWNPRFSDAEHLGGIFISMFYDIITSRHRRKQSFWRLRVWNHQSGGCGKLAEFFEAIRLFMI